MDTLRLLGYERLETLYENNRTFVCKVRNEAGETCLLKAMKDDQPTPEQLARFEYEYTLLNNTDLHKIIGARELVRHYKGHVMVFEDLGGTPLADIPVFRSIRHGEVQITNDSLQSILKLFIEMSEILGKVHDCNIIHRDINPANFWVLPDQNRVTILDFGSATIPNQFKGELHSQTKGIEGTLAYVSPEQTGRTDRAIDYRTDFYSLGASMYELITGQKPFITEEPLELVYFHIAGTPAQPHELVSDVPEMVSNIIMKLMEKEPEKRYQSAMGVAQDLGKCLEVLRSTGGIEQFDLGINDNSARFQISKKLYGRELEKSKIEQVYAHVAGGATRLLLVGGYAGVGKTSIIQEMRLHFVDFGGVFVSGKADQFQKPVPYSAFAQAAKELVGTLLQESDSLLEQWKERLLKALNGNGRLIIDIVPELELLIGPQPRVNELGPAENRNRFLYTFCNFFKAFLWENHPLILFLEDLQWFGQPSIELIKYLLSREDLTNLLLIVSYRNNELKEGHPIYDLLEELQESEKTVALTIQSLEEEQIEELLADTLHQLTDRVRNLAGIVYKKTQGNPFFVNKFLLYLYEGHYLRFNETLREWEWETKEIDGVGVSDNIIDFMTGQVMKLPLETLNLLKIAGLIGNTFDLKTLSAVTGIPTTVAAASLRIAIECQIITPDSGDYIVAGAVYFGEKNIHFRFVHDRAQQACVAITDVEQQKQMHLKIGRFIKSNTPQEQWPEHAMVIVSHLNEALEGIEALEERLELARLNLYACQKAKASSAFYPALQYIENCIRLLSEDVWTQNYEFAFAVFRTYIECAYLNNKYELAEEQAQSLLSKAKTSMEQADILLMQSTLYNFQGRLDKAIRYAFLGLKLLRMRVPNAPGMLLVLKELLVVKLGLLGKNPEDLLDLPPIKNERIGLVLQLLNEINRAAYLVGNTNLFLLSIIKRMQLTLRYGNARDAGNTYVAYAMILAIFGDYTGTYKFCELALLSHEKEKSFECRPTTLFSCGFFGHSWNRSWRNIEQWFEKSLEEAVKYGDHHTIALAGSFIYAFKPDESIRILAEKALKQFPLVRQTNNRLSINFTFLMIHRWLNYAGLTDGRFTMSVSTETHEKNGGIGILYKEEECLANLHKGNYLSALGVYYKEKMYIHYLYDDYAGAIQYLAESDKYITYHTGTPYIVECSVCSFLVLAANIPTMGKKELREAQQRMRKEYNHVKSWAKHCPVNFEHLKYLMEAEIKRLAHRIYEAADLYDRAILTARKNGFMRDEALANELAAKMYLDMRNESLGAFFLAEAAKAYRSWGANAKVNHMKEKYGNLLKVLELHETSLETVAAVEALDLTSFVTVYKAVSKEAQLPNLLRQIMKTVIENSGAQKGYILLKSKQGWTIEAKRVTGEKETEVLQSIPFGISEGLLPSSVINFCIHSGETIVLGDAANTVRFCKEPYILKMEPNLFCVCLF